MPDLRNLEHYVQRLSGSRILVAEKRKFTGLITDELNNEAIVRKLSATSGHRDEISWMTIFDLAKRFAEEEYNSIKKEIEKANDPDLNKTQNRRSSTTKKSLEFFSFFKIVVSKFSEAVSYDFPSNDIVNFCFQMLDHNEEDIRTMYCKDVAFIISKHILCDPSRYSVMSPQHFESLISCLIDILIGTQATPTELSNCTETLKGALAAAISQRELSVGAICDQLATIFGKFKQKPPARHAWENIVACANIVFESYGLDHRFVLCEFGENVGPSIIEFFDLYSEQPLQKEVTKFFCFQCVLHHPNNISSDNRGSVFSAAWKGILQGLFSKIQGDLVKALIKCSDIRKTGSCSLSTDTMELCSRIIIQFCKFNLDVGQFNQSQLNGIHESAIDFEEASLEPARKRQRVESGWESVLGMIRDRKDSDASRPWLELMEYMMINFFDVLSREETILILKEFISMTDSIKKTDILRRFLVFFRVIILRVASVYGPLDVEFTQLLIPLRFLLQKLMSSRSIQAEVILLMSDLVECGFCKSGGIDLELMRSLGTTITEIHPSCLNWVRTVLTKCDFDERLCAQALITDFQGLKDHRYSFRLSLIEWLLTSPRFVADDSVMETKGVWSLKFCSPVDVAEILVLLVCDKPSEAQMKRRYSLAVRNTNCFWNLERQLVDALCLDFVKTGNDVVNIPHGQSVRFISAVAETLISKLIQLFTELIEAMKSRNELGPNEIKNFIDHWSLHWCCSMFFGSMCFPAEMPRFQELLDMCSEFWVILTSLINDSKETKRLFLDRIQTTIESLMERTIDLSSDLAPERLVHTIYLMLESESDVYGSPRKRRVQENDGFFCYAMCAFGSSLKFSCRTKELSSTQIPLICRDFVHLLRESPPLTFRALHLALRQISKFFETSYAVDQETSETFLDIIRGLLYENRHNGPVTCDLLQVLAPLALWTKDNERFAKEYIETLLAYLPCNDDKDNNPNSAVTIALVNCFIKFLEVRLIPETCSFSLKTLLGLLSGSVRVNLTVGRAIICMVKNIEHFEEMVEAYEFLLRKEAKKNSSKSNFLNCYCITLCNLMVAGPLFHVPCFTKLLDASCNKSFDGKFCQALLRRNFSDQLPSICESNTDVLLAYWIRRNGSNFDCFPYELWNSESLANFLKSYSARLIPLASITLNSEELDVFVKWFNDSPYGNDINGDEMLIYGLAAFSCSLSDTNSSASLLLETMNCTDIRQLSVENFLDTFGLLLQWIVFERQPISNTIELSRITWGNCIERLSKAAGSSTLTDVLVTLPERSIPRLLMLLRCFISTSPYKNRWLDALNLLMINLNFPQMDQLSASYVAHEMLYLASITVNSMTDPLNVERGLKKLKELCSIIIQQVGNENIGEHLHAPLASVGNVRRRFKGLEKQTIGFLQAIVQVLRKSKEAFSSAPLTSGAMSDLQLEQIETRRSWTLNQLCNRLLMLPMWMLSIEELDFASKFIADGNFACSLDKEESCKALSRKVLRLLSITSDKNLQCSAMKLLSKLSLLRPSYVLDAFFYSWDYSNNLDSSVVAILDECIRSEETFKACLAAECLSQLINLIPSLRKLIDKAGELFSRYKVFLPNKANNLCLESLDVCRWIRDDITKGNDDRLELFLRSFCQDDTVKNELFLIMKPLLLHHPYVGEIMLPYIIEYGIREEESFGKLFAEKINYCLVQLLESASISRRIGQVCIRCIIGCIKRIQYSKIRNSGLDSYGLLPIDYCLLAEASSRYGLPSVVPLFTEIATEPDRSTEMEMRFDLHGTSVSLFSAIVTLRPRIGKVLLDSYLTLRDTEALESLGEFAATDPGARFLCYESIGDINKLVTMYSTIDNINQPLPWYLSLPSEKGPGNYGREGLDMTQDLDSCAWKLCLWDALEIRKIDSDSTSFDRLMFDSLKQLDYSNGLGSCSKISSHIIDDLRKCSTIPQVVQRRMILVDDLQFCLPVVKTGDVTNLFEHVNKTTTFDFDERQWCQYAICDRLLHCKNIKEQLQAKSFSGNYLRLLDNQLRLCRRQNLHHVGLRLVQNSKRLVEDLFGDQSIPAKVLATKIELQEVELLRSFEEPLKASVLLNKIINGLEKFRKSNDPQILCCLTECFVLMGEFKRDVGSVGGSSLCFTDKFSEIAKLLKRSSRNKASIEIASALGTAHIAMAQYANRQYQDITDYVNSPLFLAKKSHIEKFKNEFHTVNSSLRTRSPILGASVEEKTYMHVSKRKCDVDGNEIAEIIELQQSHLITALTSYLNVLALCNDHDILIFRVVALWFDNLKLKAATKVIEDMLPSIKTYKWLTVFPQMVSRLTTKETEGNNVDYAKVLLQIISSVVSDHPFHTFYTLYAMAKTDPRDEIEKDRQTAVKEILAKMLLGKRGSTFSCMKKLITALMTLHTWKPSTTRKECEIPADQTILSFNGDIPLPTMTVQPNESADYSSIAKIQTFERNIKIMSGLSAPKRITCLCSDGVRRRFLLKGGQDDPRQDAIMEQLFNIVNIRLRKKERESGSYQGQYGDMRTYNIVPLSPTLGLIEYCEGCISLGEYLVGENGKDGARARYYPKGPSSIDCRQRILNASKETLEKRLGVFLEVCQHTRPVFRHFFYERFDDPNEWYERRRAYTTSVAVSCMVGHIVGLSDRHVQNIMIDEMTGELVQIDHGMAFEQGRLLPTPETVPFRLTREITNPMGICGLDGLFRRSCVRTLTVLKESRDILMPILSVLLHDPVSQWTLTMSKAQQKQPERRISDAEKAAFAENKNVHAERAILRVSDKLNGREKTELLSVDGQVSHLINLARDPKNLCAMYAGWQAYL